MWRVVGGLGGEVCSRAGESGGMGELGEEVSGGGGEWVRYIARGLVAEEDDGADTEMNGECGRWAEDVCVEAEGW